MIIATPNGSGKMKVRTGTRATVIRIRTDYDALARIAAAASKGIDGKEGLAETRRFTDAVIDPRDRVRWQQAQSKLTPYEHRVAVAEMIALLNRRACYSDDPDLIAWGWAFRKAIEEFRAGDQQAFTRLAYANYLRWAS